MPIIHPMYFQSEMEKKTKRNKKEKKAKDRMMRCIDRCKHKFEGKDRNTGKDNGQDTITY
jgi:hypothetical protein